MATTVIAAGPLEASVRDLNSWSHKELMALPVRKWDDEKEYDSLLLVSTRKKHDSGWAIIAIIGVRDSQPEEIACACCDDIEWKMPPMTTFGNGRWTTGQFRTDCAFRSGALHAWQRGARFKVGAALSSTTVEMIPNVERSGTNLSAGLGGNDNYNERTDK